MCRGMPCKLVGTIRPPAFRSVDGPMPRYSSTAEIRALLSAGMFVGAALVGIHMAMTHGVTLAMMASYIPTKEVPGIGKISGTCWSFTDFVFGAPCSSYTRHLLASCSLAKHQHVTSAGLQMLAAVVLV